MLQRKADGIGDEFVAELGARVAAAGDEAVIAAVAAAAADANLGEARTRAGHPVRWLIAELAPMAAAYALITWLGNG